MSKQKLINRAVKIAANSKCRYSLGAVLVNNGKVRASSPNILLRVPSKDNFRWANLHAEEAVLQGSKQTKGRNRVRSKVVW